jgi:hypothetical protein
MYNAIEVICLAVGLLMLASSLYLASNNWAPRGVSRRSGLLWLKYVLLVFLFAAAMGIVRVAIA